MTTDKQKIVAARALNHGGRFVAPGEELECSAADAHYYTTRSMGTYGTREMKAQAPAPAPVAAPAPKVAAPAPQPPAPPVEEPTDTDQAAALVPPQRAAGQSLGDVFIPPGTDEPKTTATRRSTSSTRRATE